MQNIKLKWKIIIPLLLVAITGGGTLYFFFVDLGKENIHNALMEKARSLVLAAESAREYTAMQNEKNVFKDSVVNLDDLLMTVPIVAAMNIMKMKAEELGFEAKVPKVSPRNPDNIPDEDEIAILAAIKKYNLLDTSFIDTKNNQLRYFRAIRLTEDCLACHGDPETSKELWGRDDGKDITGTLMEGWKAGEVHGAFELKVDLTPVQAKLDSEANSILMIVSVLVCLIVLISIVIAQLVNKGIGKVNTQIGNISRDITDGKLTSRNDVDHIDIDFKDIARNTNKLIEAFVKPIELSSEYIAKISEGNIPEKITEDYKGDFDTTKQNINGLIDNLTNLTSEVSDLVSSASEGELDKRADVGNLQGEWADLLKDVNNLADAILEPIGGTVEALDRMANGDLSTKMSGDFKGDHAKLKDAINTTLEQMPFEEATSVLETMANGDFTMRMQKIYKGDSEEFKQNINVLAESMNSLINEINSAVNTTASSSVQLETTADTLATSIQELASQTDEVATAVEQMSSTITENADNINNTNDAAQSNMDIAVEGGKVVSETVEKMGQIGDVVSQSASNIEELGRSSKKIGEIINVIDEIADQTNLLALNAAIEAARAGEQGRGFAVVADEVRKLAERTGGATKEITGMVKEIQEQTSEAVDVMENGKIEVEKGITLAGTAGNSLEQIVDNAKSILERINFIADASREQSATSEEISKNVTAIAEVTQDSSNRVGDVSGLSGGLNQLTNDLSSLMSKFQTSENAVQQPPKLRGVESRYLGS